MISGASTIGRWKRLRLMLMRIRHRLVLETWTTVLRSAPWAQRVQAAERLGQLKEKSSVPALIAALTGSEVSTEISLALGPQMHGGNQDRYPVRAAAAKALGLIGDPRAEPALISALDHPESAVQIAAIQALSLIGGKVSVEPLVRMLRSPEEAVQRAAVAALARLEVSPARWLVEMLRREAFDVRNAAARALGLIRGPLAIRALVEGLQDTDYQVRRTCVDALAGQGKDAVDSLLPLLQSSHIEVRAAAIEALGRIRDPRAMDPLKVCLRDGDRLAREAAWKALEQLSWPAAKERGRLWRWIQAKDYPRVVAAGAVAIEPLIDAFRQSDKATREEIVVAVRGIGLVGAENLTEYLLDEELEVRRFVGQTLSLLGWVPPSAELRAWLAIALGRFEAAVVEGKESIQALAVLLRSPQEGDREMAALTLGQISDPQVVPLLFLAAEDSTSKVRRIAAQSLGKACDEAATAKLTLMLKDEDYNVRAAAEESLSSRRAAT
jgi:HEAT repeat protein